VRQTTPRISRADARDRFLDNLIPFLREQVAEFEHASKRDVTPDPDNCRLIADEGRKILRNLESRRTRARSTVKAERAKGDAAR
jgi:hypothetical protein